jgi:hypothetical protein
MPDTAYPTDEQAQRLMRELSARLLQHPHAGSPRAEMLAENPSFFSPRPSPDEPLPVVGAAVQVVDEGYQVVLFTTSEVGFTPKFTARFGTRVTTRETGPFKLAVIGGDSISHGVPKGSTGTLGCVGQDAAGDEYALSSNHVIANVDQVWSPGAGNGGTALAQIGVLTAFETVQLGGVLTNVMDAAVARLNANGGRPFRIHTAGAPTGVDPSPAFNVRVQKYGDTTKHRTGRLTFKTMSLLLDFDGQKALFVAQYGIVGDSGSLVLNMKAEAVGLVMAIAGTGEIAVANPIDPILRRFGLSF